MSDPIVQLSEISKAFDGAAVLRGLDLRLRRGETLSILGGSGTGKSVLLKLIMGLVKPDAGRIVIAGRDVTDAGEDELADIRRRMGMVFQGSALFDSLTVSENIAYPLHQHARLTRGAIQARVRELLRMVGLEGTEEVMPGALSGGMRKRVAVARAIALEPEIVLYDEPTTGLDPANVERIDGLIAELHARLGSTAIVVTHDLPSAFRISTRIALLREGRIAFEGSPQELLTSGLSTVHDFVQGLEVICGVVRIAEPARAA